MRDMGAIPRAWEGKMSSITICKDHGIVESGIPTDYTWLVRLSGTRKIRYLEAIAAPVQHHRQVEALGAIRSDP